MKALSFGEILWDVYPDERFIGGAPLNFAAHLARHGEEVHMLSAVGDDALGAETLAAVRALGVGTNQIAVVPDKPTGRCLVSLEKGTPVYDLAADTAYDHIPVAAVTEPMDLLYFGTLALRSDRNRQTLKTLLAENAFGEVLVDVNIRPPFYSAETLAFCMENATVLKVSAEELPVVLKLLGMEHDPEPAAVLAALARRYPKLKILLLTCGAEGAYGYDCAAGRVYFTPAHKVTEVSAVGAGDSFCAAFISRYLGGQNMADCLVCAAKVAAFVVSQPEAVPMYNAL